MERELASLKAIRKAKKKEIQAWIAAFEEREGRPPDTKDKEAVRPMYREFRELEAKIASLSAASDAVPAQAASLSGIASGDPTLGRDTAAAAVRAGEGDVGMIKKERDDKKREIKQWIKEFEEREGHTPSTKEKAPIKDLYREFKELERRLAGNSEGGAEGDAETAGTDIPLDLESVKEDKKRVKREIQAWLDEFEGREGRAAQQEDKVEIRPLYKRHKDLERQLARLVAESSRSPPAHATDATSTEAIDPTATLLSPSSSAGAISTRTLPEDQTDDAEAGDDGGDAQVKTPGSQELDDDGLVQVLPSDDDDNVNDNYKDDGKDRYRDRDRDRDSNNGSGNDEDDDPAQPPREEKNTDGDDTSESGNNMVTAQEARVRRMRARFLDMKSLMDEEPAGPSSPPVASPRNELGYGLDALKLEEDDIASAPPVKGAKKRWALLGDAIAPNRLSTSPRSRFQRTSSRTPDKEGGADTATALGSQHGAGGDAGEEATADDVFAPLADDEVSGAWVADQMSNLLLSDAPPPPPPTPPGLEKLEAEVSRLRAAVDPPVPPYAAEYQEGVRGAELVVASVGVEEVRERERKLELERLADAREETNIYRAREANLLYREDRARRRVVAYKREIEKKVNIEKQAIIEISIAGERALAPAFARARRGLERAIQAQAGRVREVFGELRPGETPGGRRFRVDWQGVPQPVEIRLHCIRAVRDRLPRGSYVMLSSMAERLGGRVMRWRKSSEFDDFDEEDSIDTDGGDTRPAATLPVKHGGRYFDRELRLDQNVYQLCPSKTDVRPGNVLVFELFRLAGSGVGGSGGARCGSTRHKGGELDEDTAVGWCVLPLADSRLRIVRGSFRIPMLRGEPNPNIDLHEGLEKLIAADLEAWLGNLYLDIRHLPREARLDGPGEKGGSAIGGEGFDIEYDHVRKVARLGKGLMGRVSLTAGRWQRWKARKENAITEENRNGDEDDDDNDDDDASLKGEERDIEAGVSGRAVATSPADSDVGVIKDVEAARKAKRDSDGTAPKPSSDEEKGTDSSTGQQEVKPDANEEEAKDSGGTKKKKKKKAWFGTVEKKRWIDDALPPDGTQKAPTVEDMDELPKRNDGGIEAPPPQGGWASLLKGEEDDTQDNVDRVKIDETIDEECLSDDDMPRGRTFRFTPAGEAALAVDTAAGTDAHAGGSSKSVGLRRRGEGARWDSAALGLGHRGLPKRYNRASTAAKDSHVWTPLTDPAEMEFYRFAVASDPGTDAPPTPAHIIAHKLRYIQQEVLLDMHPRGWRVVEYWLAVMVFTGAMWLRVYIHALGQWAMLYALGVPVFSFEPRLWEFAIKYMDRSSSLGVEIAFVWWGPTFVMLCFVGVAALARLWGLAACGGKGGGGGEGVPESFSRFVAAFGVAAGLDPYLLFIVDFMAGNHNCVAKCVDYTSPTCRCHVGDAWKLYVRLDMEEGAGISGALLTVLIYSLVSITVALILHQYLLHAHMNGRMLDVWRRLNANEDNFFIPHDLELSAAELQHACVRARKWRGPNGARREVVFYDFHANDEEDGSTPGGGSGTTNSNSAGGGAAGSRVRGGRGGRAAHGPGGGPTGARTTHVVIYDVSVDAQKSLHRQFLQTYDGTILEVFGEDGREVGWQLTSSLNALMRAELGEDASGLDGAEKDQGIFAGMLPPSEAVAPAASPNAAASAGAIDEGNDRNGDGNGTGVPVGSA
eukprot:g6267.t1